MKEDKVKIICLISMAFVALSGLGRMLMYFQKKFEMPRPFVPDAVVEQIITPYMHKGVFLLTVAGITLIPFFMRRHRLTIGICVIAMIIERCVLADFES